MDVTEGNILVGDINATLTNDPVLSTGIEGNALKLAGKLSQLSSSQVSLQELTSTHLNKNGVPSHSNIQLKCELNECELKCEREFQKMWKVP